MTNRDKEKPPKPGAPVAIVRLDDLSKAVKIGRALVDGGINAIEFTMTNERALGAVSEARERLGDEALVGAGSVLDGKNAKRAAMAGAQFLVTPVYRREVIEIGQETGVPVVCGAFSPTEVLNASEAGADLVKVFPARGPGPGYIKDLLAPLPDLKLVPTGGVNLENCAAFIQAGAYTVAIGSSLVDEAMISKGDWRGLSVLADRYAKTCAEAYKAYSVTSAND